LAVRKVPNLKTSEVARKFSQLSIQPRRTELLACNVKTPSSFNISNNPEVLKLSVGPQFSQVRTLTKFSMKTGKRKSVKAVIKRFKRLDWGIWIRTRTARHKKLWKKTSRRQRKLRQHVFTNSQQSWMLDKMVTTFWRRPKYYVDDPYTPYQSRENHWSTKRKPIDWN
jgi:large subunit ribosomal protein L35